MSSSAPRPSWLRDLPEILCALWLPIACAGWHIAKGWHGWQMAGLAALTLVAGIVVLRRALDWLCGPVLFYEAVREGRRGRVFLIRALFGLMLLLFLSLVYSRYFDPDQGPQWLWDRTTRRGGPSPGDWVVLRAAALARFNETVFFTFLCVQFAAVLLLTPAYTAGTIAEEKHRCRLEFLFATQLNNREIVLGKLLAALGNMGLILITGAPILAFLQLLGGVDPDLVIAGYITIGLTMLSLASLSMLSSVYAGKPRDAILITYLVVVAYLMVSLLLQVPLAYLKTPPPRVRATVWSGMAATIPTSPELAFLQQLSASAVERFNAGNPMVMLAELRAEWSRGTPIALVVPRLLRSYAVFHGLIAAICIAVAVWRLRAAAWPKPQTRSATNARMRGWRLFHPSPGRSPMLWKEIFAEPYLAFHRAGKIGVILIAVVSFAPFFWFVGRFALDYAVMADGVSSGQLGAKFEESINVWVRLAGSGVACLMLVGVAVRAASAVSGEFERQTFDSLRTTALGTREILFAKWLGSILCVRGAWLWLLTIWAVGLASGALHVSTIPWLVLTWTVYAGFFAAIGLWLSLSGSGTLRATLLTLGLMALFSFGHWLPWFFVTMPREPSLPFTIQTYGLTPPAALGWLAFHGDAVAFHPLAPTSSQTVFGNPLEVLAGIVIGLVFWSALGVVLWRRTLARFRALGGPKVQTRLPLVGSLPA